MEIAMYIIWAVIFIIAVVVELHTSALIGWAAAGASVSAIITHAINKGDPIWQEIVVFIGVWAVLWIILFLFGSKLRNKLHDSDDGFMAYIGQEFEVATVKEDKTKGEIKINDKFFRFTSDKEVSVGEFVVVEKIRGVTFTVKKETK